MMTKKRLYLIFLPAFLVVGIGLLIRIVQYKPLTPKNEDEKNGVQNMLPILEGDGVEGNVKSSFSIVIFSDFSCPACKEQYKVLSEVLQKNANKIRITWKGLGVATYPFKTEQAHYYAYCANKQNKFSDFKKIIYAQDSLSISILNSTIESLKINQSKFETCLQASETQTHIENNKTIARSLNVQSVPTIFINEKQIRTPETIEAWEAIINAFYAQQ